MENPGLKLTDLSDTYFVRKALEGDQKAFHVLYSRYNAGVHRHVGKYIYEQEELEDVVSETFQKAFGCLASYDDTYKFSTWIFRIARNTAFDHASRSERQRSSMPTTSLSSGSASDLFTIATDAQNPEYNIIRLQEYEKTLQAIDALKDSYRVIARMNLVDNYGYAEIAAELGLPLNTVKTRIRRAKQMIAKMVESDDFEL